MYLEQIMNRVYEWGRDFPKQLQERKNALESIFRMEFQLENDELNTFHSETGIRGNENIPITVRIGKSGKYAIEVPKRGTSAYNKQSPKVAWFISQRISFNYIQAVRTENMAFEGLNNVIRDELMTLQTNKKYMEAVETIDSLQQEVLDKISEKLYVPLKTFMPKLRSVRIYKEHNLNSFERLARNEMNVVIDDGIPTSISYKGDGIKSLVTLAILKNRSNKAPASVIAIEEPESHLHSGAIHELVDVIKSMSVENQVIITTHNPLFVQQNNIKANVIVEQGTAHAAKNIAEIRETLGVMPTDNLRDANKVLVVEGEDDKIALSRILPAVSEEIGRALGTNTLVIKPLHGASNLSHELYDLKNCLCKYVVLLDNDEEGRKALDRAMKQGLLTETEYKLTVCPGSKDSEFEDCLKKEVYQDVLNAKYDIRLEGPEFRNSGKWSDRVKAARIKYGGRWTDTVESQVKIDVAEAIPERINEIDAVLIKNKSGFIWGIAGLLEKMLMNS